MWIIDAVLKFLGFVWDKGTGLFRTDKPLETTTKDVGVPNGRPTTENPLKKRFPPPVVCVLLILLCGCAPSIRLGPEEKNNNINLSTMTKDELTVEQLRVSSTVNVKVQYEDLVDGKKVGRESEMQLNGLVLVRPDIAHNWGLPATCAKVQFKTFVDGFPLPLIPDKEQVRLDVGGWYITVKEH